METKILASATTFYRQLGLTMHQPRLSGKVFKNIYTLIIIILPLILLADTSPETNVRQIDSQIRTAVDQPYL